MNIKVEMKFEKETKNTYRYEEVLEKNKPPMLKYLYIQKYAFEDKPPSEITVVVS